MIKKNEIKNLLIKETEFEHLIGLLFGLLIEIKQERSLELIQSG